MEEEPGHGDTALCLELRSGCPAVGSGVLSTPMSFWTNPASFNLAPVTELGFIHRADPGAVLTSPPRAAIPGPPRGSSLMAVAGCSLQHPPRQRRGTELRPLKLSLCRWLSRPELELLGASQEERQRALCLSLTVGASQRPLVP